MNRSLILEDFSGGGVGTPSEEVADATFAEAQADTSLDAYESGYKSGWADCAKAEAEERKSVGAHLAQTLRDAELTYETARKDVFDALRPFFGDLIDILLPRLAAEALGPVVSDELHRLLETATGAAIEIQAAPGACESIQRLLDAEGYGAASLRAEPAFADSQISLRVGTERRDIDLSEVTEKIAAAIRGFQSQMNDTALSQGAA